MFTLLLVVLGIGAIIGIHEACHMLVSKLFGVKVLKFSMGFGPILLSKQIGDTSYELRLLPLGGFVQCDGETPEDDHGFFALPWWKRSLIALAGPVANLILGFTMIFLLLTCTKGWPIIAGFTRALDITWFVISTSLAWVFGHSSQAAPTPHVTDLSGPVMVTKLLVDSAKRGFTDFAFLLSIVSLSLGLFNLFPIPGLDGGHIFLYVLEGARGHKFSSKVYALWGAIGIALLVGLMLFTCLLDISKLVH